MNIKYIRNQPYTTPQNTCPTKLIAAAILYNNHLYTGKRHFELINQIREDYPDCYVSQDQQGFYTDDKRFVMRQAAKIIALKSEQLQKDIKRTLLSEDLW